MEDLAPGDGTPDASPIPQAGEDPDDPLRPEVDEDEGATPPLAEPQQDMDATEEGNQVESSGNDTDEPKDKDQDSDDTGNNNDNVNVHRDDSDEESELSDIDEAQFEDFDPAAIDIEERPIAIDESNASRLQSHKRKRKEGEETSVKKKKKESRREREKKTKKTRADSDDNFEGGEEIEGKRTRKKKDGPTSERRERRVKRATPENEEDLTPEERRRRALDKAMDEALKNPNRRQRRVAGIDLEAQNDELIENMRVRMTDAAKSDAEARENNKPAMAKLKLLPEVTALLNRNNLREQLVDPDTNLLEAVRFFLEPLSDGSLPAHNIQRELFSALSRLPISKDALIASGIGKVTAFYTKSTKPEASVKRVAERLVGEWSRPILKRSDDYRKRELKEVDYVSGLPQRPIAAPATAEEITAQAARMQRERLLDAPIRQNRARVEVSQPAYTIVPKSRVMQLENGPGVTRRIGAGADDAFRRMTAKTSGKGGGGSRR